MKGLYLILIALVLCVAASAQSVSHSCPNGAPPTTGDCPSSGGGNNNGGGGGSRSSGLSAAQIRHNQLVDLNNEAVAQINAGDCASAKLTLVQAMNIDWYYGMAHYNYAICLMQEGNYDGVVSSMQMVLGYGGEGVNGKKLRKLIEDAQAAQRNEAAAAERKRQQEAEAEMERQHQANEAALARMAAEAREQIRLNKIGEVGTISGSVWLVSSDDCCLRQLQPSDVVWKNAHIRTGVDSHVQFTLLDGTTFTMGPNSDMVLDEFVYDPNTSVGKITARITKGVFRWVTGKAMPSRTMNEKIKVPTGTIGIRGTDVEVSVGDQDVYTCNYWNIRGDGTPKAICKTVTAETVITLRSGEIDTVVPWYTGRQVKLPTGLFADEILFTTCAYSGPEKLYDYYGDYYDGKPMLTLKASVPKRFIFLKDEGQVVCDEDTK